ncbi:hypothetical protein L3X38_007945 [Prunus dulcis]|uniref:Uncharacterized protein n=1 Tax=Prunus dulcis TaxID=3755 RepID=A0AAD4ZVK7_PRUDU|nr:hypothetical protein L3X38_007945 [Prunus dulcis]
MNSHATKYLFVTQKLVIFKSDLRHDRGRKLRISASAAAAPAPASSAAAYARNLLHSVAADIREWSELEDGTELVPLAPTTGAEVVGGGSSGGWKGDGECPRATALADSAWGPKRLRIAENLKNTAQDSFPRIDGLRKEIDVGEVRTTPAASSPFSYETMAAGGWAWLGLE